MNAAIPQTRLPIAPCFGALFVVFAVLACPVVSGATIAEVFPNTECDTTDAFRIAQACDKRRSLQAALYHATRVVAVDVNHADAFLQRAQLLTKVWRLEEAWGSASRAIDLRPKHIDSLLARAEADSRMNQFESALDALNRALAIDANHLVALMRRGDLYRDDMFRLDLALGDFEKAMEKHPKELRPRLERAFIRVMLGNARAALAEIDAVLAENNESADAWYFRGRVLSWAQRDGLLEAYGKAIELDPNHVLARRSRAIALGFKPGLKASAEQAKEDLKVVLHHDPYDQHALCQRGKIYFALEEYDKALADFDAAVRIYPLGIHAQHLRAGALLQVEKYDRAIADLNDVIKLGGNYNEDAYRLRGYAWLKKGDADKAIADLNRALQFHDRDGRAHKHRAAAYRMKGDDEKAGADEARAAQLGDDTPSPIRTGPG